MALPLLSGYGQAPVAQAPNGPEQTPPTGTANVSPSVAEVIKLAESGVGEDVILSFIQNSKSTYDLSADDVFYLKDVGLTSPVITAMLNHDKEVGNQTQQSVPTPQTLAAPSAPEAPPATAPLTPAPIMATRMRGSRRLLPWSLRVIARSGWNPGASQSARERPSARFRSCNPSRVR